MNSRLAAGDIVSIDGRRARITHGPYEALAPRGLVEMVDVEALDTGERGHFDVDRVVLVADGVTAARTEVG